MWEGKERGNKERKKSEGRIEQEKGNEKMQERK